MAGLSENDKETNDDSNDTLSLAMQHASDEFREKIKRLIQNTTKINNALVLTVFRRLG